MRRKKMNWTSYWQITRELAGYWWPKNKVLLRFCVLVAIVIMLAGRIINVILPIGYKNFLNTFQNNTGTVVVDKYESYINLIWYLVILSLSKTLDDVRSLFFTPALTNAQKQLHMDTFKYLNKLGMDWHSKQQTGKTMLIISRGQESAGEVMNVLLFEMLATCLDIIAMFIILSYSYGIIMGSLSIGGVIFYVVVTLIATEKQKSLKKRIYQKENAYNGKELDCLLNMEVVKAFAGEGREVARLDGMLSTYFETIRELQWWTTGITLFQSLIGSCTIGVVLYSVMKDPLENSGLSMVTWLSSLAISFKFGIRSTS